MGRIWSEIRQHGRVSAAFAVYWSIVFGLDVFRWHKAPGVDDMVPAVMYLHVLLPVLAGALAGWWRYGTGGSIPSGMITGAWVLVADVSAMVAVQLGPHLGGASPGGERVTEAPVFLIALGLLGSALGLAGAGASTLLGRLFGRARDREMRQRGARALSRGMPRAAAGLALGVAAAVSLRVVPAVRTDVTPGPMQDRAATAFAVNAILNVAVAIVLAATAGARGATGRTLVATAGFVSLLLGASLVDAAAAFWHGGNGLPAAGVCGVSAAGDVGAAVLCLIAARGRGTPC
jgi:hypothetical protein